MSTFPLNIQDLSRRLLALVASPDHPSDERLDVAEQLIEELRITLIRFAGVDGFRSLLSRALTLSKAEIPSLKAVQVDAGGSLEGFDKIEQSGEGEETGQAGIVLVTRLLELLVTFIGAPLTLHLLRDTWPDASMDEADLRSEEKP